MDDKTIITIAAMGFLTLLESVALFTGLDGTLLLTVAGFIAALGGVAGALRLYEMKQQV